LKRRAFAVKSSRAIEGKRGQDFATHANYAPESCGREKAVLTRISSIGSSTGVAGGWTDALNRVGEQE